MVLLIMVAINLISDFYLFWWATSGLYSARKHFVKQIMFNHLTAGHDYIYLLLLFISISTASFLKLKRDIIQWDCKIADFHFVKFE